MSTDNLDTSLNVNPEQQHYSSSSALSNQSTESEIFTMNGDLTRKRFDYNGNAYPFKYCIKKFDLQQRIDQGQFQNCLDKFRSNIALY